MIAAPYSVSFEIGLVTTALCLYGQEMSQLIRLSSAQKIYTADGYQAEDGFFKPLGGATVTLDFAVRYAYATHALAMDKHAEPRVIDGLNIMAVSGNIVIQHPVYGFEMKLYSAVVRSLTPTLPSDDLTRSICDVHYSIVASVNTSTPSILKGGMGNRAPSLGGDECVYGIDGGGSGG